MKAVPRSRNAACVVIHWSATPSPYGCGISDVGSASSASPARSVTRGASAKVNGRRTTGCRVIRSGSKQFDPLADCGLYVRRNFNRRVVSLMLLGLRDDRHRSWTELSAPCVGLLAYCVNSTAACRPHASTRNSRPIPLRGSRGRWLAPLLAIPRRSPCYAWGDWRRREARASASSTFDEKRNVGLSASSVDSQFPVDPHATRGAPRREARAATP